MFEDYLEDSSYFVNEASKAGEERDRKRCYRVAIFCAMAAVEAFVNYIAETLAQGDVLNPYQAAFLRDKKFGMFNGEFQDRPEYNKIDDKLQFLILKFVPDFDFAVEPCWSQFHELKRLRDAITHPRREDDEVSLLEYQRLSSRGLDSAINIMDRLCKGIFRRPLRPKLLDLRSC